MMDMTQPVKVAEDLWWVGSDLIERNLQCNPFLLLQDDDAILFDPGSVLDFDIVLEKVRSLVPLEKLDAIVCSHQDPDLCSSLPLFEKAGYKGPYCCHQRAANMITYYGIDRPFYFVDYHKYSFPLSNGSHIKFIPAPYLHFPGAIMSYLPQQKVLVSGDLFGSVGTRWQLFAQDGYEEGMKTYHEAYMPSHEIMKPVMDQLTNFEITTICPQHGSVINHDVDRYIDILRDLQCGRFLRPVQKDLLEAGGYLALCNRIVTRFVNIYSPGEVRNLFAKSPFIYSAKDRRIDRTTVGEELVWDKFFELVLERKGMGWITVVAPMVELLSKEYSIALPDIYRTQVVDVRSDLDAKDVELREMELQKIRLEKKLHGLEESLSRDPITGLYNHEFHQVYLLEAMADVAQNKNPLHCVVLSIDNLGRINLDFGGDEGNATLKRFASMILQMIEADSQAFRLAGAVFAVYCTRSREEIIGRINAMLASLPEAEEFIVPITVSVGLYSSSEFPESLWGDLEQMRETMVQTARYRMKLAQKRGGNLLVSESTKIDRTEGVFAVMLIDNPGLGRNLIRKALEKEGYQVEVLDNGLQARKAIEQSPPDLIISELKVPKINAIALRKELLAKESTRKIPFLLMSYAKNETTVGRAMEVYLSHFFWRPVMMVELLGVVGLIAKRLQIQGN